MQSMVIYRQYKIELKKMLCSLENEDNIGTNQFYNDFKYIIKSQFMLMLYTTLESIVMTSIQDIFDDIYQKQYNFYHLTDKLKQIYLKFNVKHKERHFNQIISDNNFINIFDRIKRNEIVNIDLFNNEDNNQNNENPFSSGSLDYKNINECILKKFGINIDKNEFNRYSKKTRGDILKNIENMKNYRNQLAHGEKTFDEIGRNITIKDLKEYFLSWIILLRKYLKSIQSYIDKQEYKIIQAA